MSNSGFMFFKSAMVLLLVCLTAASLLRISSSQVSGNTVVKVQPADTRVEVGDSFSISVVIESVENLYGLDVTLRWNSSVVEFVGVDLRLGVESHSDGVLHENGAEIYVADENATGAEYHLAATSVAPSSSFNGSGTVFVATFKAINAGVSPLALETELADHPLSGETANLIDNTAIGGSVDATGNGSGGRNAGDLLILILAVVAVAVSVVAVVVFVFMRKKKPT